jgi:hypothetical protein
MFDGPDPTGSEAAPRKGRTLSEVISELQAETGLPKNRLNVLAHQNDPYFVDTPSRRAAGEWFAGHLNRIGHGRHLRGVHYALLGETMPNGKPYNNTFEAWDWLQEPAAKAARWLGLIPFDAIKDERNDAPRIIIRDELGQLFHGVDAGGWLPDFPAMSDLRKPHVYCSPSWSVEQPYRIAIYGEKSSLEPILGPISNRYGTDLFLMSGECTDTHIHAMARAGAEDGRKLVVMVFADCDPSGYQMLVSIAHKLRAFKDLKFPSLDFAVVPVALTVEQVQELGLPSTPLKATEKRANGWRKRYGVEQTEIDALATLQPDALRAIAHRAIAPYYDRTLDARVRAAQDSWTATAQEAFEAAYRNSPAAGMRSDLEGALTRMREAVGAYRGLAARESSTVGSIHFVAPAKVLPEPDLPPEPDPMVSSDMPLIEHIAVLRARKDYT